jgi:hypothetical protein
VGLRGFGNRRHGVRQRWVRATTGAPRWSARTSSRVEVAGW